MKNFLKNLSVLKIVCILVAVFLVVQIVSWLPQLGMKAAKLPVVTSSELAVAGSTLDSMSQKGWEVVADDGTKQLMVNPANLDIRVVDKATGTYWESVSDTNESDSTPAGPISITYLDGAGAEKTWSGYNYSIMQETDVASGELEKKKYEIYRIENGFGVNMTFASEESTNLEEYMPKMVSVERYKEYFIDKVQELVDSGKILEGYVDKDGDGEIDEKTPEEIEELANYKGYTQAEYNNALEKIYALSEDGTYYYNKLAGTPPVSATRILIDLSKQVGYNVDLIREDASQFDFNFNVTQNPRFTIPVEFTLDKGDLVVNIPTGKIINDSPLKDGKELKEGEEAKDDDYEYLLKSIHLLPNFGLVKAAESDDGFIFVPDGSGAIFELNSYDSGYAEYSRPVYDNTYYDTLYNQSEFRENVTMPVFGMGSDANHKVTAEPAEGEATEGEAVEGEAAEGEDAVEAAEEETPAEESAAEPTESDEAVEGEEPVEESVAENTSYNGFMGIIESGDITATINVKLAASGSSDADAPNNKVYPTFDLMQMSSVKVFGPYSDNDARFTARTNSFDFDCRVRYKLYTDNANYFTMSQDYRDYIIEAYGLKEKTAEEMKTPRIFLDVISSLTIDARIVGVPYDKTVSMTTYKELADIYEDMEGAGVDPIVNYQGAFNGGIYNTINTSAKLTSNNGGKADLEKLLRDHYDSLYLGVNPSQVYKTTSSFKPNKHGLINFNGEALQTFKYDIPTGEFNMNGNGFYTIAPKYLQNVVNKFNDSFTKFCSGINGFKNLGIGDLGNLYYENLRDNDQCSPYQGEEILEDALQTLSENNRRIILNNPNANRIKYAAIASDISRESSDYGLIKESVPFRQLVFNGLIDYTTLSVNTSSSNKAYFLLQALELGASPKYTITAKRVSDLKEANYNELYATEYKLFEEDIKAMNKEIEDAFAKIGSTKIVSHRVLDNKVYETTYEGGVKVITNYNTFDVTVNGKTLKKQSYEIVEGGDK